LSLQGYQTDEGMRIPFVEMLSIGQIFSGRRRSDVPDFSTSYLDPATV